MSPPQRGLPLPGNLKWLYCHSLPPHPVLGLVFVNSYVDLWFSFPYWNAGFKRAWTYLSWSHLYPSLVPGIGWASMNTCCNEWRLQVVAVEPQQGLVNNSILMLPKSQIRGITWRVSIYSFKNWWSINKLKHTHTHPNENKNHYGNQVLHKRKINFKRLNIKHLGKSNPNCTMLCSPTD